MRISANGKIYGTIQCYMRNPTTTHEDEDGLHNIIPVLKDRKFARFSLLVTEENKRYVKLHSKHLFMEIKSGKEAYREPKREVIER
jgi:hypothetical protein